MALASSPFFTAAQRPSALMADAMTSNLAGGEAGRSDRCAMRTGF